KRKFKLLFPSTPPESPEHFWASELIPKAKEKGTYVELTIEAISDLPEEEKLRLINEVGGIESAEAQREFYCKIIVDASRAVAPSFKPHHVQTIEPTHIHWQIFGDTGGVRDLTVFLQVGWSHELQKTIFRDELWFPAGTPTTTIIKAIKSKWPDFQVIMDAPGQLRIDYSSLGLTTMAVQKDDFAAGLLLLNTSLLNQNVLIHPDCKLFIRTLEGGMLNGQRTDHLRTDSLGHNDAAAAGIYGLRGVDKVTDLRPKPNPQDTITIETHTELETTFLHAFKRKA
ncbi:MAG TPA: hypothetical protein V6C65_38800, partial [Allocoleopsis sp.]